MKNNDLRICADQVVIDFEEDAFEIVRILEAPKVAPQRSLVVRVRAAARIFWDALCVSWGTRCD